MPLTEPQRKHLRRLGHDRDPVVLVGQGGISPNLIAELDRALKDHELVKVRARVGDRATRDAFAMRVLDFDVKWRVAGDVVTVDALQSLG